MAKSDRSEGNPQPELSRLLTRNPYLKIVHCGDDEIVVKHGSRSRFTKNIRDEGRTKLLSRILRNLVPPAALEELLQRNVLKEEEVEDSIQLVGYLRQQGVLIDPAEDLTHVYIDTIMGGERPLSEVTVGLVGAGYLGSRIAHQLAALRIGKLVALDGRTVEREAVDRLYFALQSSSIREGEEYVGCLAEDLAARGFEGLEAVAAPVDSEKALEELAEHCDFLVVSLEIFSPSTLHLVNTVVLQAQKPWISIYIDGSEALVGPIFVPGESCCYNEFEIQHEATLGGMKDEYLVYKEALDRDGPGGAHFALPPFLDVASGLASTGIARFLLSGRSFLVGRANRIDFERLSIDYENVLRLPRCPACGPARPGYRNLFM